MSERILRVHRLGTLDYAAALQIQKETEAAVKARTQPDTLLLVEHPHTVTLGRRTTDHALLVSHEHLAACGVTVFESNRGGKATYHGFGQLVGYPVINLSPEREDVHKYVRDLETVLIAVLSDFNIEGFPVKGLTGVHTEQGKVAAIGIHIARWVTTHGFALNVNTDLDFFKLITPCEGEPVASMKTILGREQDLANIENRVIARFAETFDMNIEHDINTQQQLAADRHAAFTSI